ncbi:MAG: transcription termination/antitermination protein NusG [Muribaculaceae bacterium]|nr:transcription termination/antitermination protein NusG [Muribaculaceae bacterium]
MIDDKTDNTTTGAVRGWYVLRAISGKEAQVKEVLEGAMKRTDLGKYLFQVLIPTERVVTVRSGNKKVVKERNLYSGYVFIEAIPTGEVIHELTNTTNVIDFLRGRDKGSAPERLREAEVMRMLGAADELAGDADSEFDYMVGEQVKVTDGAFKDFRGVIEEVYPEKRKLKLSIKIFDRMTPLELDDSQVERE